jgi:hypothetical protein
LERLYVCRDDQGSVKPSMIVDEVVTRAVTFGQDARIAA